MSDVAIHAPLMLHKVTSPEARAEVIRRLALKYDTSDCELWCVPARGFMISRILDEPAGKTLEICFLTGLRLANHECMALVDDLCRREQVRRIRCGTESVSLAHVYERIGFRLIEPIWMEREVRCGQ